MNVTLVFRKCLSDYLKFFEKIIHLLYFLKNSLNIVKMIAISVWIAILGHIYMYFFQICLFQFITFSVVGYRLTLVQVPDNLIFRHKFFTICRISADYSYQKTQIFLYTLSLPRFFNIRLCLACRLVRMKNHYSFKFTNIYILLHIFSRIDMAIPI